MSAPILPHDPSKVKLLTEKLTCPIHNRKAEVDITEHGEYLISTCCEEFKAIASIEFDDIFSDNVAETIRFLVQGK